MRPALQAYHIQETARFNSATWHMHSPAISDIIRPMDTAVDTGDRLPATASLEHLTGPSRGRVSWFAASALDVSLESNCVIHISESVAGDPGPGA